jgi:protein TonB
MKRNKKMIPEFDEIIFGNRNRTYGAYDLRKKYNSIASLSVISAVAFCTFLTTIIFLTSEQGTAKAGSQTIIVAQMDSWKPEIIKQPEIKPPPELIKTTQNVTPEVVTDTSMLISDLAITDDLISAVTNGNVSDNLIITEVIDSVIPLENKVFIYVEEMPEFPGGNQELLRFIGENLNYPEEAQKNNIQGRVILKFVINPDGTADRIEVLRGIDPLLDNEAIRVIRTLPRFKPGKQGGVAVPVWFTIPVVFRISNN